MKRRLKACVCSEDGDTEEVQNSHFAVKNDVISGVFK